MGGVEVDVIDVERTAASSQERLNLVAWVLLVKFLLGAVGPLGPLVPRLVTAGTEVIGQEEGREAILTAVSLGPDFVEERADGIACADAY